MEQQGHVLVVDDVEANRDILERMLTRFDYKVTIARNGDVALKLVRDLPDLVLLDINMPGLNGFEVCEQIKADDYTKHIPVIFISALDATQDKVKAFQVGGIDYITKPFQRQEVLSRVKTQLQVARQHNEIIKLNQLKDQMVGTVSHDLKNPIAIIMGYSAFMIEDPVFDENPELKDMLLRIYRNSQKMNSLVTNLLDVNKIENGIPVQKEGVSVTEYFQHIVEDFEYLALEKSLSFSATIPSEPVEIMLDPLRFEQVMNNLLSNAIKYTPEGNSISLFVEQESDTILIAVQDTGLGIPEDEVDHVFESFFRVSTENHMSQSGTGLGLSIAKGVVEQHGGNIWVESILNEGSTFFIRLPLQ